MEMAFTDKYGVQWSGTKETTSELQIEFNQIRLLYFSTDKTALVQHYLNAQKILWPEDFQHRWFIEGMTGIVKNKVTCLLGCASSGKTYLMASHALITFWVFPETSFALISSTTLESLKDRIWGRGIVFLFNRGKKRFPWLPGYVLEASRAILTDEVDEDGELARQTANGIKCVPCKSGGRFIGLARFQGIKPPNSPGKNDGILTHYGDESATMEPAYLDAYTNWMVSKNFKGVQAGNPSDISDPLCIASEPPGGWDAFIDNGKTQMWHSRWHNAFCIAFDGRDTPNNDEPKNKFSFLADTNFVEDLIKTYGDDSWQVWQQGIGKPSRSMVSNRVITIGFCEQHKAFDKTVWKSKPTLKIGAIDPAYGGGDRCVFMPAEIGTDSNENQIIETGQHEIVPIKLNSRLEPEQQIAAFAKERCDQLDIPPQNMFYDSFGRGTLGFFFAEIFGSICPVPVNSGDKATDRPVRFDYFVQDESTGKKRLKRCDEEYFKFVTEMWFSVRECIHSDQLKNLFKEVAYEGQLRLYRTRGKLIELETKDEMKERVKKSPDLFDTLAILVEGARRRGFKIQRIGSDVENEDSSSRWLTDLARTKFDWHRKKQVAIR